MKRRKARVATPEPIPGDTPSEGAKRFLADFARMPWEDQDRHIRNAERRREVGEMFAELGDSPDEYNDRLSIVTDPFAVDDEEPTEVEESADTKRLCAGCGLYRNTSEGEGGRRCEPCAKRHTHWYLRHHPQARLTGLRKRSPHGDALLSDYTDDGWRRILAAFDQLCAYCGVAWDPIEQDHIVPISKGGHDLLTNLVPACGPCNLSKHARPLAEWLRSRGSGFERGAMKRIRAALEKLSRSVA